MENAPCILFFVKAPLRGRVKTRLAAALGEDAALELYRSFGSDLLSTIDRTGIPVSILFTPPDARDAVASWLGEHRRYAPQAGADLGERMQHAFRRAFDQGVEKAVLVGSDLPDLPGEVFAEALHALVDHDAVIGPAADGGYYLVGFRRGALLPSVFRGMAWGTGTVLQTTLARLNAAGSRLHLLRQWHDVDTVEDLRALRERAKGTDLERSRTLSAANLLCGTMNRDRSVSGGE